MAGQRNYTPSGLSQVNSLEELKAWLATEHQQMALSMPGDTLQLDVLHRAPKKPRNGMIVYADGVDWIPGAGEGFYGYENGSWVKL